MVNVLNLDEIKQAMEAGELETFAPVRVYVVNHMAEVDWPRKYVYSACPRRIGSGRNGRGCGRTIEGLTRCPIHPDQEDGVPTYRFEVFLSDGLTGSRPLQATIFDAAAAITAVPADHFKNGSETTQQAVITSRLLCMPEYQATLRVRKGRAYVQSMTLIGGVAPRKYHSFPLDAPVDFRVERGFNLTPESVSSSQIDHVGSSNAAVQEKVAELVDLIAQSLSLQSKNLSFKLEED